MAGEAGERCGGGAGLKNGSAAKGHGRLLFVVLIGGGLLSAVIFDRRSGS
jgi:hypothetical protein